MDLLEDPRRKVLDHARVRGEPPAPVLYRLICPAARVTVRSQQMRAYNLAWALGPELANHRSVAVIGGGAAGLSFAALAALQGGRVQVYEQARALHLQQGSWHRPLHPEIYRWPEETAFRPVSHLAALGWTTGSAHAVAQQLRARYRALAAQVPGQDGRLNLREMTRVTVQADNCVRVERLDRPGWRERELHFDLVVLAVGFGIESQAPGLAVGSYWRSDALDQPFLAKGRPTVLISGAGDGALIDLLRCCSPETDQAAFLDRVLVETLLDQELLKEVSSFDPPDKLARDSGREVEERYLSLDPARCPSLARIDALLFERRRPVTVHWLYGGKYPFDAPSLPINRFLASRLIAMKERIGLVMHPNAETPVLSPIAGGRHFVEFTADDQRVELVCDLVLCRWGPQRCSTFGDALASAVDAIKAADVDAKARLVECFGKGARGHEDCHQPTGWPQDKVFDQRLDLLRQTALTAPVLTAQWVRGVLAPDAKHADMDWVYRIRIGLNGLDSGIGVCYVLHPDEEGGPVRRHAIGGGHPQWLNTRNDYAIRVETADGREWRFDSLLTALAQDARGAMVPLRRLADGGRYEDAGMQRPERALRVLEEQTTAYRGRARASPPSGQRIRAEDAGA